MLEIGDILLVDAFTLLLDTSDGSEKCYYQIGTGSNDVISDVLVGEAEEGSLYPGVTIAGYTEGSLAGPNGEGRSPIVSETPTFLLTGLAFFRTVSMFFGAKLVGHS